MDLIIFFVIGLACILATLGGLLTLGLLITVCYGVLKFGARKGKDYVHELGLY